MRSKYRNHVLGYSEINNALEEDPICQLTPSEKLRLCATILTSSRLRKKVNFFPIVDNVQLQCETRRIYFRSKTWQRITDENEYEERMIACKTSTFDRNGQRIVYYVSRGYGTNRIFLYKLRDRKVFLENFMIRVSVVKS